MVRTVEPKDWHKTLETAEEYFRGIQRVDRQHLSYRLRDYLIHPVAKNDPMHRSNGIKYFTHNEENITRVSIISGHAALGSDPEAVGPFTNTFIIDRALNWDNMFAIFQGSNA